MNFFDFHSFRSSDVFCNCLSVGQDGGMDGGMDGRTVGWMDGQMVGWMDGWTSVDPRMEEMTIEKKLRTNAHTSFPLNRKDASSYRR